MKTHNRFDPQDPMDNYIRGGLKNWAAKQQPPANIRARLLLVASATGQQSETAQTQPEVIPLPYVSPAGRAFDPLNNAWLWIQHFSMSPMRYGT